MKYFISVISIIFIFSSCKDDSENSLIVYRVAEEGLQRSNKNITLATNLVYHALEEKMQDPATRETSIRWQPIAGEIKEISDSIVKYINGLKEELKNEAGGNDPKNKNWENSMGVSEHLFESHGKGKELLETLLKYKNDLLAVDPKMKHQFEHSINIFSNDFTFIAADTIAFTKTFFSKIPVIAAMIMLSKFENNVRIIENNFISFCNSQMCILSIIYDSFAPLVSLSSSYVKGGEEIEINAGVGAFTTVAQPRITINNKGIAVNENGLGIYRFKTPEKSGKYQMPVKIEFTREDGSRESMTKNIEYTVIEENKAP